MKNLVLSAMLGALVLLVSSANGQKLNFGVSSSGALPLGDIYSSSNIGFGGGLSLDYYFNDKFNLGLEARYLTFNLTPDLLPISLTAAVHHDIDDWIDLYGELGAGAYISNSSLRAPSTYFGFSPRVGLAFELTSLLFLNVSANYHYVFSEADLMYDYNWVGLDVGLLYTLGEF